MEVSVTAAGARPKDDGETAGDVRGLMQVVVVIVAVVSVAATGEPVEGTLMRGVPPSSASAEVVVRERIFLVKSATSAGIASALWSLSASWWESPQLPGRPERFSRPVECGLTVSFVPGAG